MFTTIKGSPGQRTQFEQDMPCHADELMERCQVALDMYPDNLHATIHLHDSVSGVRRAYFKRYGKECDYVCWMSKSTGDINLAVSQFDWRILAHEMGHVIVEAGAPGLSFKAHEVLAQTCARDVQLT